jgi:hypothetical protein
MRHICACGIVFSMPLRSLKSVLKRGTHCMCHGICEGANVRAKSELNAIKVRCAYSRVLEVNDFSICDTIISLN